MINSTSLARPTFIWILVRDFHLGSLVDDVLLAPAVIVAFHSGPGTLSLDGCFSERVQSEIVAVGASEVAGFVVVQCQGVIVRGFVCGAGASNVAV